jgi:hypothetical protein
MWQPRQPALTAMGYTAPTTQDNSVRDAAYEAAAAGSRATGRRLQDRG